MKYLLLIIGIVLFSSVAYAGDYTISLNQNQEDLLERIRVLRGDASKQNTLEGMLVDRVRDYKDHFTTIDRNSLTEAEIKAVIDAR